MFDIGFWEMVLIAVVALVVVGPKELPVVIRTVGAWVGRARAVAGEFKDEFNREVARAEELKKLVERETQLAEMHKAIEDARKTISLDGAVAPHGESAESPKPDAARTFIGDDATAPVAGGQGDERTPR